MEIADKTLKTTGKATRTRTPTKAPLDPKELELINAWWDACINFRRHGSYPQRRPVAQGTTKIEHVKRRLLGHWGASPALSRGAHLNRLIKRIDLDVIFMAGLGMARRACWARRIWKESYSEVYPDKSQDEEGMRKFFKQFSFPGHIGSHVTPETPGSIHEGGELGYSLSHAYGACFDNPELIVACVVGDGEAETGPLATAWHSNKFINPIRDRRRAADL